MELCNELLVSTCLILLINIRFQPNHGMLTLNPKLNHVMSAILRLYVVIFAYTNPSETCGFCCMCKLVVKLCWFSI
jgi:hypothetical protein